MSEAAGAARSTAHAVASLVELQQVSGSSYLEFIRRDSLSVGLYVLPAGATDPQRPHTEDEVYFVVEGMATLRVAERHHPVGPGTVVFVEAGAEHRFEAIESDLRVLVFFAPAEGTRAKRYVKDL